MPRPFVFLEQEGSLLVRDAHEVASGDVTLAPGASAALRMLQRAGFGIAVMAHRPPGAAGLPDEGALLDWHRGVWKRLAREGVHLDGLLHRPDAALGITAGVPAVGRRDESSGRLMRSAARAIDAHLERSWVMSELLDAIDAAHRAGCRAAFVDTGAETEWMSGEGREPDVTTGSIVDAARAILRLHWADVAAEVTARGAA